MSSTPAVIWDDQPKAPPVATASNVQWDDEQPQAKPVQQASPYPAPAGLREPGNINLTGRPILHNSDGTISSEKSFSIGTDKGETLLPLIVNGKELTQQQAIDHYRQTGEHMGIFDTPDNADAYATQVHNRKLSASGSPVYVYQGEQSAPQVPPAIAAQNAIARQNIAKYPENQAKPDPDYVTRKNAFEAVQGEPGAPQDFQEDPEQERLIKAQAEVQSQHSMVPQAAVPALQTANKYAVQPFERASQKGAEVGRDLAGRALVTPPSEDPASDLYLGNAPAPPITQQEVEERLKGVPAPVVGATRAVGSVVGGMAADPRMWPLFFAGPEASGFKTAMSAGFGTQMAVGAYQQAGELGKILDNPDVPQEDKWEAGANMILSTIMAAQAYGHPINEAIQTRVAEFHNLPPADQAQIAERLRQKAPEIAAEIDQHVASPQTQEAAPQVTWDDRNTKPERFRLPRGSSAAEVQGPVQGPNIRTVQVGDKTYAFDQRKVNADGVTRAVERGELWRLSGGKAPEAVSAQAEQDLRGEEPEAPKQEAQPPAVQWDDEKPAEEPQTKVQVPVMITRQMEADLRDKGLSQQEIDKLTPAEAHAKLQEQAPATQNLTENEGDRRAAESTLPPEEERRVGDDRRQDVTARARVADLTPEERAHQLLTSELIPDMPNKRAFEEDAATMGESHPHVGYFDVDDFKPFNTLFGHEGADTVLRATGKMIQDATAKEPAGSIKTYHRSGDEFNARSSDPEAVTRIKERVNKELADTTFTYQKKDGTIVEKKGTGLSHGIGTDHESAEAAADLDKQRRKELGLREGSRDIPEVDTGSAAGQQAPVSEDTGRSRVQAEPERTAEVKPPEGIPAKGEAGRVPLDRNSPLFRDTEASGQGGLFGEKKDSERGSATLASSPIPALIEGTAGLIKKGSDLYHGAVDKALDFAHMGQTRPEIRKFDPDAADLATKMDAGGQYHKAVAEMIGKKVTGPLTEKFNPRDTFAERQQKNELSRDRMKGFHFMADEQNREWAKENKPEDYKRWNEDPKIQESLKQYKPFEEQLRSAVQQLGGKTIDADYIKRIMDFATSGVAYESPTGELKIGQPQNSRGGGRDNVVSPQIDRSKSRKDAGQYYWDHGVYDFGPSFQKRWTEVMSKLDEHRLAVHAMSMGTRVAPDEPMPEKVFYNGQEFYRPDVAHEIKEVQKNGVSPESKALANALGVSELPTPKNVRQYSTYEPLRRGSRFESAARNLAADVLAGKQGLEGQAANVSNMSKLRYALPKEIVEALNDAGREKEQGALAKKITQVIGPLTQFIRQQIVGLAYGVPHMANILRKVVQSHPLGALNPMGWADAFKVAFSKELKARGISGPEDPTYDMLLRNGAVNEGAIPEYKHYIEGNFNPTSWEGLQEATKTAGNAFRKGGKEGAEVTPLSAAAGAGRLAIEPLNRFSEAGHRNLFKQGGIDQRARIWLGDFLKDRYPGMKENRIAHEVNQTLGRYNRASWTDVQKGLAPFMLFPGWDYSSAAFAMKHPFNTAVAPAVLMLLANAAVNSMGGNKSDEKHDLERLHVGKYSGRANILNDNMGSHLWGWALRGAKAGLDHKNAKETTGEMVKGIPGDVAGVTTGTMNPIISTPIQIGANRLAPGRQQEIVKPGDLHKRGKFLPNKAAEDYTDFAARRAFPLYDRATQAGQKPSLASFAGLAGVNISEKKKKR